MAIKKLKDPALEKALSTITSNHYKYKTLYRLYKTLYLLKETKRRTWGVFQRNNNFVTNFDLECLPTNSKPFCTFSSTDLQLFLGPHYKSIIQILIDYNILLEADYGHSKSSSKYYTRLLLNPSYLDFNFSKYIDYSNSDLTGFIKSYHEKKKNLTKDDKIQIKRESEFYFDPFLLKMNHNKTLLNSLCKKAYDKYKAKGNTEFSFSEFREKQFIRDLKHIKEWNECPKDYRIKFYSKPNGSRIYSPFNRISSVFRNFICRNGERVAFGDIDIVSCHPMILLTNTDYCLGIDQMKRGNFKQYYADKHNISYLQAKKELNETMCCRPYLFSKGQRYLNPKHERLKEVYPVLEAIARQYKTSNSGYKYISKYLRQEEAAFMHGRKLQKILEEKNLNTIKMHDGLMVEIPNRDKWKIRQFQKVFDCELKRRFGEHASSKLKWIALENLPSRKPSMKPTKVKVKPKKPKNNKISSGQIRKFKNKFSKEDRRQCFALVLQLNDYQKKKNKYPIGQVLLDHLNLNPIFKDIIEEFELRNKQIPEDLFDRFLY